MKDSSSPIIVAVVVLAGAAFGPRYGPFLALYAKVIRPRLGPPKELEDPRPPRFSADLKVIQIDVDPLNVNWIQPAAHALVGDARQTLLALRLAGALHALVLSGRSESLGASYPPNSADDRTGCRG